MLRSAAEVRQADEEGEDRNRGNKAPKRENRWIQLGMPEEEVGSQLPMTKLRGNHGHPYAREKIMERKRWSFPEVHENVG